MLGIFPHPFSFWKRVFPTLAFHISFSARLCVCVCCHQTGRVFFCRLASSTFTYFLCPTTLPRHRLPPLLPLLLWLTYVCLFTLAYVLEDLSYILLLLLRRFLVFIGFCVVTFAAFHLVFDTCRCCFAGFPFPFASLSSHSSPPPPFGAISSASASSSSSSWGNPL